jgi:tRNA threonylcarbamoyladenosine biosynthesis protein TsaE
VTGRFTSHSESDTRSIAKALSERVTAGTAILLCGDLGAGKTAFVKGLAEGLGLSSDDVTSPTFTLVHEYRGGRLPLIHVDLYRLERADLDDLGMDAQLADEGVLAIEWAERLTRPLPAALSVLITDAGDDEREIVITIVPSAAPRDGEP